MNLPPELSKAIERYENYVKVDANNPLLWIELGDLYHRAGRLEDATACYERCLTHKPDHAPARSRLASVMITQHRFAEAEKALRELMDGGITDPALLHNLGLTLYYQQRWDEAKDAFGDAAAGGLKAPTNYAYLARTFHHLGRMEEAIDAGRRWADAAQNDESKSYLALLYMDDGNTESGRELALDVLSRNPDDVDANVVAGACSVEQQEADHARRHFEIALRHDKDNGRAWLGLGLVHLYDQEYKEAIDALENATRIYPDNPGIVVTLGWAKIIAKDPVGAEQVFEQALRVDRNFSESHGGLAAALAFQQKLDRAEEEIKLAKRLDPASFGADIARTVVLAVQGKQQNAADVFTEMLERSPQEGVLPLIEQLKIYTTKKGLSSKSVLPEPKKH